MLPNRPPAAKSAELPQNPILTSRPFLDEIALHDFDRSGVRCRCQSHGPVRANHQAIRSERPKSNVEKRDDLLRFPMLPVGLGDQSRELAQHIRKPAQPRDALRPGIDVATLDRRLGKMIEDKTLAREPFYKFGGDRKMPGVNQDVVGQIELFPGGNAAQEVWLQQEAIVGFTLYGGAGFRPVLDFAPKPSAASEPPATASRPSRPHRESRGSAQPIGEATEFLPESAVFERKPIRGSCCSPSRAANRPGESPGAARPSNRQSRRIRQGYTAKVPVGINLHGSRSSLIAVARAPCTQIFSIGLEPSQCDRFARQGNCIVPPGRYGRGPL